MPPKPKAGSGSSSGSSSSSSGSSGSSSSSSSSSSGSGSSSDSDSSASQGTRNSRSSASSATSGSDNEKKKKAKQLGATTRSRSASSATESDGGGNKSKKSKKPTKSAPKVAPKKSATAKTISGTKSSAKKFVSDDDSDSDFGELTLTNLALKAKQTKKIASSGSSSAKSTPTSHNKVGTPSDHANLPDKPTQTAVPAATSKQATKSKQSKAASSKATASTGTTATKYKSIFSESSDSSDSEIEFSSSAQNRKSVPSRKSPSPPKLTPQKKSAPKPTKVAVPKAVKKTPAKAKAAPKRPTRSSSVSSEASLLSSASGTLSQSSTEDSDSSARIKKRKSQQKNASNRPKKSGVALIVAARSKKTTPPKRKNEPKKVAQVSTAQSSESDSEKVGRRATRQTGGTFPRRSQHIVGKRITDTESEDDDNSAFGVLTTSAKKKGRPVAPAPTPISVLLPPVRKDLDGVRPIAARKCPVPGCDSSGHLGGKLDHHFLPEACPVYHNMNRRQCRDFRAEVSKKNAARKKALASSVAKSPLSSPNADHRRYAHSVNEARQFTDNPTEIDEIPEDRELDLHNFASEWDLKLFREAQALASEDLEASVRELPDTKTVKYIEMGKWEMETWYQSPYPEEYTKFPKLYICEFCLKYLKSRTVWKRHAAKCVWKHPPGDEIYRKDKLSVFEICGKRYKQYCQSLCLLAKFFLDHKTLYFDVEPFLFYVMTTADSEGCHIVGYFSKEKNSLLNYNVSCILTLPPYQRQGYGRLLIDFSYLLSRSEGKIGSPEKPLSDLGLITYRSYWKDVMLEHICNWPEREISIKAFSEEMGINSYDIVSTLQYLGMIKYWKGKHVILKKEDLISDYMEKLRRRPKGREIHESALKWKPYEPTAKERRQAEQIKKSQEEKTKKRSQV